jgi:glycosyltransferase involved in cell wall biosynthesis
VTDRLTLCYLVAPGEVGGLERVVHGLALGTAERGHAVHVVAVLTPEPADAPFLRPFRGTPVHVHEVRLPPGVRHFGAERRAVARLLDVIRPDVVHSHGYRPDILDAGLARRRGIPVATTIHGESFMGGRTALYEWLQWRAYRRFDAIVAVSSPLEQTALRRGVPGARIHRIPNAWPGGVTFLAPDEARRKLGLPVEGRVVGWLGRMIPVKGADVFIRAAARLASRDVHVCLIGDGPERAGLEALAKELGLSDRITFTGAHDGGARYLSAFDVFVLSSRSEGTPIVLLEAMSAARPIVATHVGGVPDVLGGDAGLLVPPDHPEAMAQAMALLLDDAAQARNQAARGLERVRSAFSTAEWLTRHDALYRVLSAGARDRAT